MKQYLASAMAMAVFAGLAGCTTLQDSSAPAQEREDYLILKEDLNRTKGRLESLEMEYQRLAREVEAMKSASAGGKGQESSTQTRLDDLDRRVQMLDAARAKDRQAIVDQISAKMADLMGSGATAKPAHRSKPSEVDSATPSATGYEHVVKEGETLSAIAAAYKVKPSAIIEANRLKNPDALTKGQKLFIPQP